MSRRRKKNGKPPAVRVDRVGLDDDGFVREQDFRDVYALTLALQKIGGVFRLSPERASRNVYHTLSEGMTLVARNDKDEAIGTLGLQETQIFYSEETVLWDKWFIVLPEHQNGLVGKALLKAATELAEEKEKILVVTITNPDRQRKTPMKMSLLAQEVGYIPRSYSLRLR